MMSVCMMISSDSFKHRKPIPAEFEMV